MAGRGLTGADRGPSRDCFRHQTARRFISALLQAGVRTVFTLSGNRIMPVFDAAFGTDLRLVPIRHQAAAVHMADAFESVRAPIVRRV